MIERLTKGTAPSLLDTDKANEIIDTINAILNSKGGDGVDIVSDQNGQLTVTLTDRASGNDKTFAPLEVIEVTEEFISVNPGTVNNELVTPIRGIDFTKKSTFQYLSVDVTVNNEGSVTAAELKISDSAPDGFEFSEDVVPDSFEFLIAIIQELTVIQVRTGNVIATPKVAFQIPKDEVDIGEYDHHNYYQWELS